MLTTYFKSPFEGERQREKNQMCPNAELSAEAGVKSKRQRAISGGRRLTGEGGGAGGREEGVVTNLYVCRRSCLRGRSSSCGVDTARC